MAFLEIVIMVTQLILGLSILVGIHEFGHMISAKMFGMRVEKFSIGFPPKIIGTQVGETEYSLGAIPLGGFVKITGMIDESLDTENLGAEPEPYEFRAKPAWQRLIVMLGGIIMNVLLGILIFIGLMYILGDPYISKEEINKFGVYPSELGKEIGFERGDKVLTINGQDWERFTDITGTDAVLSTDGYYEVQRGNQVVRIDIPNDLLDHLSDREERSSFITPLMPFKVGDVAKGRGAAKAGLQEGDQIVKMAGHKIDFYQDFQEVVTENKGKEINLTYLRDNQEFETKATLDENGILGFNRHSMLRIDTTHYSFFASIPQGTKKAFKTISDQVKAFGKIFRGEVSASKSLSGPIGIAKIFGSDWDWVNFWTILGLLSMILAFMNFLPIPALDGGHVIFIMYEIISGRKPGDKFLEVAQKVGMVILLGLMTFAIFNDIFKEIF